MVMAIGAEKLKMEATAARRCLPRTLTAPYQTLPHRGVLPRLSRLMPTNMA